MSTEYGAVRTDEESRAATSRGVGEEHGRFSWHNIKRTLHLHGHRVFAAWIIVIAVTAVLTLSFYFAYKDAEHPKEGDDNLLLEECVSDRSWFIALMLSIFLGPFGIDRFYLGYFFLGVLKLLTAGLAGIWWTVDIILIALNILPDHPNGCHLH